MTTQTLVIDYAIEKKIVSPAAAPLLIKVQPTKSQIKKQVKRSSKTE
jgi:hypothetical protein